MMHSTGTTNNSFVRKDLLCRNGIYYLVDDILKHDDTLHMNEIILVHKLRNLVANNPKHDLCWSVLQTYDPITHEPIPKHHDHVSSNSAVSSPSVQSINSPQPTNISTTTSTIPTAIPTTTTTSNTTTTPTTSSAFSIPSIAHAHLSSPVPTSNQNLPQTPVQSSSSTNNNSSTPHIAKSFRSPPPSDYFVNNAANLSYLSISQYFKLPLHEACVALRVDESSLKKRCRELGIRRWPYRKRCNISSGKGNAQTQQAEEQSSNGDQLFSCFQLNKGKGASPVVQKMKSEEALALEALDKLHNVSKPTPTTTSSTTATATSTTSAQPTTVEQPRTTTTTVNVAHPQQRTAVPPPTTGAYTYPPYPHPGYPPHMYQPHPGYHYPYGVPPTHDGSQPVPYPMYYPPQNSAIPPPGAYPPPPGTETKDGQPTYVQPYYYDYRGYPYPPPQSGSVPPYPYPPQPGYSYPPHPEQSAYPYPPHGYPPMAYPPHQMGYPPHPVPQQQVPKPVIVSTSPAESQPVSGTPCRTVSGSTGDQTPTTPIGSPQTKMVYQRETKVLHPVRYKPPSPTESTAEIVAKIKRERIEDQDDNAKKVRRDIQIANPLCNPVSSQTVQNGPLSTSIKVADK